MTVIRLLAFILFYFSTSIYAETQSSAIFSFDQNVTIIIDKKAASPIKIAAEILSNDIKDITGYKAKITHSIDNLSKHVIAIGNVDDSLITAITNNAQIDTTGINNLREVYGRTILTKPISGVEKLLLIYGSDKRGSAYGVMDLVREMGVSPWQWWADVTPKTHSQITVSGQTYQSKEPSVKYRGIFLNDEDWALQPWAAKTFEPEVGDIGPKTYGKIFELLLRLKANMIWPAMHPSTKAFYHYPDNPKMADAYGIVVGSSHAEPMLRNNVDEWNKSVDGKFDYSVNREQVKNYWQERVNQSESFESVYTMGMRGIHDTPMQGKRGISEQVKVMDKIIQDQRDMLNKQDSTYSPVQALTPYKEVLDIYDAGLKVPNDITLVWPDDNHGYVRRLSNPQEQQRAGGSGVYYHLSYWGAPHDYLWLSSTHPALIREEMLKAYNYNARDIWIANVGDIKPLEYNMTLFLDMAFDIDKFVEAGSELAHLDTWLSDAFNKNDTADITKLVTEYYDLAYARRPEFMAWNRVEPKTLVTRTEFNHLDFNDEAERRLKRYQQLVKASSKIYNVIPKKEKAAYYQLVHYPIVAADAFNRKFINLDKAYLYAQQGRASANDYALKAKEAYQTIVKETAYYNEQLSQGKWRHMMDMSPRNLKVFEAPIIPNWQMNNNNWGISAEGTPNIVRLLKVAEAEKHEEDRALTLPSIRYKSDNKYFFDIFMTGEEALNWQLASSNNWLKLSTVQGELLNKYNRKEQRVWVSVDWDKYSKTSEQLGMVTIKGNGQALTIKVPVSPKLVAAKQAYVSNNGLISIYAENFTLNKKSKKSGWQKLTGLGHSGASIRSFKHEVPSTDVNKNLTNGQVEYPVYFSEKGVTNILVHALPTHPATSNDGLKVALKMDGKLIKVLDFSAKPKSPKWDNHVFTNNATQSVSYTVTELGHHTLQLEVIDPEVIIDRIEIETNNIAKRYSLTPETNNRF